ncbi:hypothetical protein ARMGADRAFT_1036493 [Armillaria gallica]|uniref:Uncharacterized protein n=1 Tax=Armillaria gallica TaxID=47427 RepID=A0A2H3CQ74_ARMGA|nr:hypothetical protein ARMGADRAFT_1036493 [Armillaria gallica]
MVDNTSASPQPCLWGHPHKYNDEDNRKEAQAATQAQYYQRPKKSSLPKCMMCQICQYHVEMLQITVNNPIKHNPALDTMEKVLRDINHCHEQVQQDLDTIYWDSEEIVRRIAQVQGYLQDIIMNAMVGKHELQCLHAQKLLLILSGLPVLNAVPKLQLCAEDHNVWVSGYSQYLSHHKLALMASEYPWGFEATQLRELCHNASIYHDACSHDSAEPGHLKEWLQTYQLHWTFKYPPPFFPSQWHRIGKKHRMENTARALLGVTGWPVPKYKNPPPPFAICEPKTPLSSPVTSPDDLQQELVTLIPHIESVIAASLGQMGSGAVGPTYWALPLIVWVHKKLRG